MKVKIVRYGWRTLVFEGVKTIIHNSYSIGLGFFDGRVIHVDYGSIKNIKVYM